MNCTPIDPAVSIAQPLHDLPQSHLLRAFDGFGRERPIHLGFAEVVERRIELWKCGPRQAQGIDLGNKVPANSVGGTS